MAVNSESLVQNQGKLGEFFSQTSAGTLFNTILLFEGKHYTIPFTNVQRIALGSTMYFKTYFLNECNTTKLINSKKLNENYDCKL